MAPPRKNNTAANTTGTRRRLTDAERAEKARWAAIKPVEDAQLDSFYDPATNSLRTFMLWQPEGSAPTDMSRAEIVYHDSLDGKLHYCDDDERVVDTAGQLQGRVDEERLVSIPKEFRLPKNADAAVSLGRHTAGATYSFNDVAKWMGLANNHLQTPVAASPVAASPARAPAAVAKPVPTAAPVIKPVPAAAVQKPMPPSKKMIVEDDDEESSSGDDDEGDDEGDGCVDLTKLLMSGYKVPKAALEKCLVQARAKTGRKQGTPKMSKKASVLDAADECARRILAAQSLGAARKVHTR